MVSKKKCLIMCFIANLVKVETNNETVSASTIAIIKNIVYNERKNEEA